VILLFLKKMKRQVLLFLVLFSLLPRFVFAGDGPEQSTEVLRYLLPATAAVVTLVYKDIPGTLQLGKSLVLTSAITYGLKAVVHEDRPNHQGNDSFPSGHTAIGFASAEVMRKRYGWKVGGPVYAAATFIGYSRIQSRAHHVHDVVAGAGIGILIGAFFTHPYNQWQIVPNKNKDGFWFWFTQSW
jgi:membrane-associated phospholipid phosphatase